jgi:hypothetical protein
MRRRLLNFVAATSLLLAVAVAVLWAWSYGTCAQASYGAGGTTSRMVSLYSWRGSLHVWVNRADRSPAWPQHPPKWGWVTSPRVMHDTTLANEPSRFGFLGVVFASHDRVSSGTLPDAVPYTMHDQFIGAIVPYWLIECVLLALGFLWLARRRRRRTPLSGLCRRCGYDLRATPDRCPECGTAAVGGAPPEAVV